MASLANISTVGVIAGNGLVASRKIERGALIVQEDALVYYNTSINHTQFTVVTATNFFQLERNGVRNRLQTAVEALQDDDQTKFDNLFTPNSLATPAQQIVDRFQHNSFHFSGKKSGARPNGHPQTHIVVYPTICMANHSCVPNAMLLIDSRVSHGDIVRAQGRLVASNTIPAGGEIFLDYMTEGQWLRTHTTRKAELNLGWNFVCTCSGCEPHIQAQMDEGKRISLSRMHPIFANMASGAAAAQERDTVIDNLRVYIATLDTLGIWDYRLSYAYV